MHFICHHSWLRRNYKGTIGHHFNGCHEAQLILTTSKEEHKREYYEDNHNIFISICYCKKNDKNELEVLLSAVLSEL